MNKAFSLVELSIVLVILGLLVGGILAGQNLIRSAELRSVVSELNAYKAALTNFELQYDEIPGDMPDAEMIWGTFSAGGGCPNGSGVGTETCNGDGDRILESPSAANRAGEQFTIWQHMANAGLIEGRFSGKAAGGGATNTDLGVNSPESGVSNAGWYFAHFGTVSGHAQYFDGEYDLSLTIGEQNGNFGFESPAFAPKEAWNIDSKIDDGMPATGMVGPRMRAGCTDATSAIGDSDKFDAEYLLSDSSTLCALMFKKVIELQR